LLERGTSREGTVLGPAGRPLSGVLVEGLGAPGRATTLATPKFAAGRSRTREASSPRLPPPGAAAGRDAEGLRGGVPAADRRVVALGYSQRSPGRPPRQAAWRS
jgi:hypothetical protein